MGMCRQAHKGFASLSRGQARGEQEKSGIPCGLQRLSYAGKHMEDSQRTLEQCAPHSRTCLGGVAGFVSERQNACMRALT